jgi:hypothetical protein
VAPLFESVGENMALAFSLCNLCVLRVSVVTVLQEELTTKTQSTQRLHRADAIPTDSEGTRIWHPFQGADHMGTFSDGLRYATTTRYYLRALRAD